MLLKVHPSTLVQQLNIVNPRERDQLYEAIQLLSSSLLNSMSPSLFSYFDEIPFHEQDGVEKGIDTFHHTNSDNNKFSIGSDSLLTSRNLEGLELLLINGNNNSNNSNSNIHTYSHNSPNNSNNNH
eukprot:Awhi_evm2s3824